jgi:hypothetical protein
VIPSPRAAVAKGKGRKPRLATGFLVDENVPPEVSELIVARGYKVAHIGRTAPYLSPAPPKSTEDARLKAALKSLIFITQDKRLLGPGAFPSKHRGVFVLDTDGRRSLDLAVLLFDRVPWRRDDLFVNRRFLVSEARFQEIDLDGSKTSLPWT